MERVASGRRRMIVVCAAAMLLSACQPSSSPGTPAAAGQVPSGAPKVLTVPVLREFASSFNDTLSMGETAGGVALLKTIPQNFLVVQNDRFVWVPQLAVEQISSDRGTWRINPDTTMDTTWKIHPNVKWHDGAPFTSADLVFAFTAYKESGIPTRIASQLRLMQSVAAPDPLTLTIHWTNPYAFADQALGLEPMPKHLLEEAWLNDKADLLSNSALRAGFVGLGPYQLTNWEQGSHFEFARFDDYFLGRPPLDKVIVRIIPDINAVVANILSGSIDAVMDLEVSNESAVELQRRWEGTGNQVQFVSQGSVLWENIQHRPEFARPPNGLTNQTVRQAFYQALDRQAIVDVNTGGLGTVADSWIAPGDEIRPQVESWIPRYPYDPARAQQVLAQVGWVRGPDGILVDQATGERFAIEVWDDADGPLANIIAAQWKEIGADATPYTMPPQVRSNVEFRVKFPGVVRMGSPLQAVLTQLWNSRYNASAETGWIGNRSGYSNPKLDALSDRFAVTIAPAEVLALHREYLTEAMTAIPLMPLYWGVRPLLTLKEVKGIRGSGGWNLFEWTKD